MQKKVLISLLLFSFFLTGNLFASAKQVELVTENEKVENKVLIDADYFKNVDFKMLKYNDVDILDKNIEIKFNAELQLSGKICNTLRGKSNLEGDILTVNLMSTKMLCSDELLNEMENSFAQILTDGAKLSLEDGKLILQNGEIKFVLDKKNESSASKSLVVTKEDLNGKNFILTKYNSIEYKSEQIPNIAFAEDLAVSGKVCNNFSGKAEIEDNKIMLKRVASTNMACLSDELSKIENILYKNNGIEYYGDSLVVLGDEFNLEFTLKK